VLQLTFKGTELFNDETQTFSEFGGFVLELEHSLVSLSKWESKFQKAFLAKGEKTLAEIYGYIEAMVVTENYPPEIFEQMTQEHLNQINEYIESSQSATTFGPIQNQRGRSETVTSELIYYWMTAFNIPFTCETWNLNRLFTLIRICNIKQTKQKKIPRSEVAARNRELNAQRKAQLGTRG
jgi:hypothetical protein